MAMKSKNYQGDLDLQEVAYALGSFFNRDALSTQIEVKEQQAIVQISTRQQRNSGGNTYLTVALQKVGERLEVKVSDQAVLGLAGSLGVSALLAWLNPLNLLTRLDDIAQDIENLSLEEQVWKLMDRIAETSAKGRLVQRVGCIYCGVINPSSEGRCLACGAPLGESVKAEPKTKAKGRK
jgi:hypothetical protein